MYPRTIASAMALCLATLVLAGCGGDDSLSTEEYASEVNTEFEAFYPDFTALGDEARDPASAEDYIQTIDEIETRIGETIATLEEVEPPDDASEINERLLAALGDLQAVYGPVADAVEAEDRAELQQAVANLQEASAEFDSEVSDIAADAEEAGISIPSIDTTSG